MSPEVINGQGYRCKADIWYVYLACNIKSFDFSNLKVVELLFILNSSRNITCQHYCFWAEQKIDARIFFLFIHSSIHSLVNSLFKVTWMYSSRIINNETTVVPFGAGSCFIQDCHTTHHSSSQRFIQSVYQFCWTLSWKVSSSYSFCTLWTCKIHPGFVFCLLRMSKSWFNAFSTLWMSVYQFYCISFEK